VARPDRGVWRAAGAASRLSGFKLAAMVVVPPLAIRGSTSLRRGAAGAKVVVWIKRNSAVVLKKHTSGIRDSPCS